MNLSDSAMDRLRAVHHVQVDADQVAAALDELAGLHDDVPTLDGNLRSRLDALYDDRVVHTLVPIRSSPEVSHLDASIEAALAELSPEQRHDLASRKDSPFYTQAVD